MKMRGNPTPEPSYSPDVAGLLRWLRQPPSQWSALGWQNAPAWADAIDEIKDAVAQRDEAINQRDERRREHCRMIPYFFPNPAYDNLSCEEAAVEVAKSFGWDCFRKDDEGEVTA